MQSDETKEVGRLARAREVLFPGAAEKDPAFRAEIERLSVRSLYVIVAVNLLMPLAGTIFHGLASLVEPRYPGTAWPLLGFAVVVALLLVAARTKFGRRRARSIALASGFATSLILIWAELIENPDHSLAAMAAAINVVVVMLVAVSAVPALPWQTWLLGASISAALWFSSDYAAENGLIEPISLHYYAGMDLIMFLCIALSALNYQRILETFRSHRGELEAQSRLLVSDNAITVGRFAATLSHELNNQLAVVRSSLDSLKKVSQKRAAGATGLEPIEDDLHLTADASTAQLQEIVERLQRFTNMDEAEEATVNMEQLLSDVAAMARPQADGVEIELSCQPLPPMKLRPQQISAVFSKLITRAAESPGAGRVEVVARRRNGAVEVAIRNDAVTNVSGERATVFDPGFKVRAGRVRGGNWGLYTARQAVREHGGELELGGGRSGGREYLVSLPVE